MVLRGTNQEFGRPYNRRIVLETVRQNGPISRADIARRVGLTVQTVSNIIRELEEQNFVAGSRTGARTRGYPATSLSINPDGGFAIGIHLTPLGIEAALMNLAGSIVSRKKSPIPKLEPAQAFDQMARLVAELKQARPGSRMLGVGLAMPGPFDVDSMSFVGPTTLEGWQRVPVRQQLAEISGLPAFIEVDHAAAALGERHYGAAQALRDFYYLYFGVGLGGCMVQDGLPLRGSYRNAGEIGHVQLVPGGELCPCGNRGCLERYLSLEAYERNNPQRDDATWIADVAPLLRTAIVMIENLFDPETIMIGGLAPEDLMHRLIAAASPLPNSVSQRRGRTNARVIVSSGGPDAVLRGAAALAVAGVLSPRLGIPVTGTENRKARDPLFGTVEAA
jgi:predicted NBD/HSP70 family sugar kinase